MGNRQKKYYCLNYRVQIGLSSHIAQLPSIQSSTSTPGLRKQYSDNIFQGYIIYFGHAIQNDPNIESFSN